MNIHECVVSPDGDGFRHECKKCGAVLRSSANRVIAKCSAGDVSCQHLLREAGLVECPSCSGAVRLKTFGCQLHGRCTLGKQVDGLSCCATCHDFTARPSTASTEQSPEHSQ